jgi:hypothetical protein
MKDVRVLICRRCRKECIPRLDGFLNWYCSNCCGEWIEDEGGRSWDSHELAAVTAELSETNAESDAREGAGE